MAAYLLDTHTLVWLARDPARIPARARALLSEPDTIRLVSAASAMELTTKYRIGKMPEAETFVNDWHGTLRQLLATETPLTPKQAFDAGLLDWPHKDPFDRMLAAQAIDLKVPLVTRDPAMTALPQLQVIW